MPYTKLKKNEAFWFKPTSISQSFCSNCRLTPKTNFGWLPPYCPNCGKKMIAELKKEDLE